MNDPNNKVIPISEIPTLKDLLPASVQDGIDRIPPEWFTKSEKEMKRYLYPNGNKNIPGRQATFDTDQKVRIAFWMEYNRANAKRHKMSVSNILNGVVSAPCFSAIVNNPRRLAWVLYPPLNYNVAVHDLLDRGMERLYEILKMPLRTKLCRCHYTCWCNKTPSGGGGKKNRLSTPKACVCKPKCICPTKYDPKIADVVLKAFERIELRAKGSIQQVIRQTTQNVSVQYKGNLPEGAIPPQPYDTLDASIQEPETLDEIEKRLLELQAKQNVLIGKTVTKQLDDVADPDATE